MMNKVILPKKVAEAIKEFQEDTRGNMKMIKLIAGCSYGHYDPSDVLTDWINNDKSGGNFRKLINALEHGYEVEKNPYEHLYDYYVELKECEDKLENLGQSGSQFRQGWQSVEKTLEILGIKVKGINDISK